MFKSYTGAQVLKLIKDLVLKTPILFKSQLYICQRGIAQGNILSTKLCNIYLGAMERKIFPNGIPRDILFCRYVDDYFMVSKKENLVCYVRI